MDDGVLKKKFRSPGGSQNPPAGEVQDEFFQWFTDDCIKRNQDHLKYIWNSRYYFFKILVIDPPFIYRDWMLLHWKESSGQATLNFKNKESSSKENHWKNVSLCLLKSHQILM